MLASIGIVCLDEFDKIASGQNNAIFAGAGTTKDVTGMGCSASCSRCSRPAKSWSRSI